MTYERNMMLAILGGGQIGRMLAQEASRRAIRTIVWDDRDMHCPASHVSYGVQVGNWSDVRIPEQMKRLGVRGALCEFENVGTSAVLGLEGVGVETHSLARLLEVAQSRRKEKHLANAHDISTVKWMPLDTDAGGKLTLEEPLEEIGTLLPGIVKIDHGGYDGGGQYRVRNMDEVRELDLKPNTSYILEEFVDIGLEASVQTVRSADGETLVSPAVCNVHGVNDRGILSHSYWLPGTIWKPDERWMQWAACKLVEVLQPVGVVCFEFIITRNGKILFNEMAPRPHNSFHGTIDAATVNQFTWYVDAVAGLPLRPMVFAQPWMMVNLLGDNIRHLPRLHAAGWNVHDYGKEEVRDGRKMGHATKVCPDERHLHIARGEWGHILKS